MIEYLKDKNMNGAIHANENGADNAAAGALNKCMDHGPENKDSDDDGTPVADGGTPVADDGTPEVVDGTPVDEGDSEDDGSDKPVSVVVDLDENGNGTIEYDLDGDGVADLIMTVENGIVVSIEETGSAVEDDEATPEAA